MTRNFAKVKTELPGPKAKELIDRRHDIVPEAVSYGVPTFVDTAKDALIQDVDGNQFIDFAGGIGVINIGHRNDTVVEALKDQVDKYVHTGFNVMMYDPYIKLAEKLSELTPGSFDKKVMFLNSGAEANENAIKIARKATKRPAVVSFTGGFHGRTQLTMTMTGKVKPYKYEYGPFAPEVYHAAYPYFYRKPENMTDDEYSDYLVKDMERFFTTEIAPDRVAAVIMEPVQGESGFIIPDKHFVQGIYELCKKHGILFIADEIQTGFGRTGDYFAMKKHFGVEPDLVTVSKSMAAGLPISGVVGRSELLDAAGAGELGGTYCGTPLGCRAGLAVLEAMEKENINERAEKIGKKIMDKFAAMYDRFDCIGDYRGLGAMCAMEFVESRETKEPAKQLTAEIIKEAQHSGVLPLKAGVYDNVIRLLMPLVITDEQLEEGLDILEEAMETVLERHGKTVRA